MISLFANICKQIDTTNYIALKRSEETSNTRPRKVLYQEEIDKLVREELEKCKKTV